MAAETARDRLNARMAKRDKFFTDLRAKQGVVRQDPPAETRGLMSSEDWAVELGSALLTAVDNDRGSDSYGHYGMTFGQVEHMLFVQGGRCAICGDAIDLARESMNRAVVDHDHHAPDMHVRGLLCSSCNWGEGHYRSSPLNHVRAAMYLLERNVAQVDRATRRELIVAALEVVAMLAGEEKADGP